MFQSLLSNLRFLFTVLQEHTSRKTSLFFLILLLNFLGAFMEGLSYSFMILAFTALSGGNVDSFPLFKHLSYFIPQTSWNPFFLFISLGIFSQILKSTLCFFAAYANARFAMHIQETLQIKIYKQILRLSYSYVNTYKIGELVSYVQSPVNFVRPFLEGFNHLLISGLLILTSIFLMTTLSLPLTLFALSFFGAAIFFQKYIIRSTQKIALSINQQNEEFNAVTIQNLSSLKVIHLFSLQNNFLKKISENLTKFATFSKKLIFLNAFSQALNEIIGIVSVSFCLLTGYWAFSQEDGVVLPLLLSFITIIYRMSGKIIGAMTSLNQVVVATAGPLNQVRLILQNEGKEYIKDLGEESFAFNHLLEFQNLTFKYPTAKTNTISNFSCKIKKGEIVAFVGASGAGKSTLIDLLCGLYEPLSGGIFVDGNNLSKTKLPCWREKIALVSQEIFIFNETIEENIRLGNLKATEQEIIQAAKQAHLHHLIMNLPQGYRTVVGERGYRLSGGEKQRIALARALIRKADILILDEATSHLDSKSEKFIQESLESFKGIKTLIVVAHRLSTIMNADQIFVIDKGHLVESGKHELLLEKEGAYSNFWRTQFEQSKFEDEKELISSF